MDDRPPCAPADMPELRLVRTTEDCADLLCWLGERREGGVAFDVEATGLDWCRDKIRLGQLGDQQVGWSIPWDRWSGVFVEAMDRYRGQLIGHNYPYDTHMLREAGVAVDRARCDDTMAMAHLVNPLAIGLKEMASRELGEWAGWWEKRRAAAFKAGKWDWATVPLEHPAYWEYGAADTVLTARVEPILHRVIRDSGWEELYELELASCQILADVELRGIRVDLDYSARQSGVLREKAADLRRQMADEYGLSDPGKAAQLAAALTAAGADLWERTKTGKVKMDAATLKALRGNPLADLVLAYRRAEKWRVAYFDSIQSLAVGDILHPNFRSLGARTARMAVSRPPMQQVPRGPYVRDQFIARPGHRLVLSDMDQIEIRLLIHLCGAEALREAMRRGEDLHKLVASMAYGVPMDQVTKDQRQVAKSASYTKAYCGGAERFASTARIPTAEGVRFYDTYDALIPEVSAFQDRVISLGRRRAMGGGVPYVVTHYGRRLPAERGREYALVNYSIQGLAADIFKRSLVRLDRAGWSEYLVLLVHDEAILDVPDDLVEEARHEVPLLMQDLETFTVPLTAGIEDHARWGDKYRDDGDTLEDEEAEDDDEDVV